MPKRVPAWDSSLVVEADEERGFVGRVAPLDVQQVRRLDVRQAQEAGRVLRVVHVLGHVERHLLHREHRRAAPDLGAREGPVM